MPKPAGSTCNLNCAYCYYLEKQKLYAQSPKQEMSDELLEKYIHDYIAAQPTNNVLFTWHGGEPLVQAEFVEAYFKLCHEEGLHTALDTAGSVWNEAARRAAAEADLILFDVKTVDDSIHKEYIGVTRQNNARFLDYLQEIGKPIWLRHVVVPGITDRDDRLHAVAEYLEPYTVIERVEVLPYHVMGTYKYQEMGLKYPLEDVDPLSKERKENAQRIFAEHLPNITIL